MSRPQRRTADNQEPELADARVWPSVDDDLLKLLPPVLRAVVRALGFGRARDWLAEHGGVNVCIPMFRTRKLGLTQAELDRLRQTLALHLDATGRVSMPKGDKLFIRVRNTQIRRERRHASISELARRYHLTSRHILNICRDDAEQQMSLF